jgi:prevent-host-death family protein
MASVTASPDPTVGVRELRQNLSRYLERVKDGETLVVTERGREVARLIPSHPGIAQSTLELAEQYGATVPTNDLVQISRSLPPLDNPPPEGAVDAFLDESRWGEFGVR